MTTESRKSSTSEKGPVLASPSERALFAEKIRYLARQDTVVFDRSQPAQAVLKQMAEQGTGGALIVDRRDAGKVVGIFTVRDVLNKLAGGGSVGDGETIEKFMTPSPTTLSMDASVGKAIRLMTEGGYRHLPLVDGDGKVCGMVSVRDIVTYIAEHFPEEVCNLPPRLDQPIPTQEGG